MALALATAVAATTLTLSGYLSPPRLTICLLASFAIGGIGLADDVLGLRVSSRLSVHFLIAAAITLLAIPDFSYLGATSLLFTLPVAVLVLVWGLNLFNFMDGIDGLALQEVIFLGLSAIALLWTSDSEWPPLLLGIVSGAIVTLRWNWAPARAFLGDVGSGFLGVAFAAIAVDTVLSGQMAVESWLILWGAFLVDSTVTLVTRILTRQKWHQPHRLHLYQKLSRRWGSHAKVTLVAAFLNVAWLFPWALSAERKLLPVGLSATIALSPLVLVALRFGAGAMEKCER